MSKFPLSVVIITFNEEENIGRTLESIAENASEIIIVDSGSLDKTIRIAEKFGAKIFSEEWKGYIQQKNSALEKCNEEWILSLDADEVVSNDLKNAIEKQLKNPDADGYIIKRKTHYLSKLLNHAWQPDWKLRLVKKSSLPKWQGTDVHESLSISGTTKKIDGCLIHYSYKDIKHHYNKTIEYAKQSAQSYFDKGKKFHFLNLLFNPPIAFMRLYIINLGFLDGFRGFLAGFSSYVYTFLKYVFLWELWNKNKLGN